MASQNEADKRLIVGSKQTLENPQRLQDVLVHGPIDTLIIDEAHRAAANGYRSIIDGLREANPNLKHLGVTATPERADEKCLTEVYAHESVHYGAKQLIELGWLVQPEIRGVLTQISLKGVRVDGSGQRRDYNQKQLASVFDTDNCFALVIESHKAYAEDRPAIAFTTSVAGAHRLAELFTEAGIPAIAVDGTTPQVERDAAIAGMVSGSYQILCNCGVYTEGFDLPLLEVAHIVRPTQSDTLWVQMAGRVLRLHEGKENALILDYQPRERNVDIRLKKRTQHLGGVESATSSESDGIGNAPVLASDKKSGEGVEYVVLNYFENSNDAWAALDNGWQILSLGKGHDGTERMLAISPYRNEMDLWLIERPTNVKFDNARLLNRGSFETIERISNSLVRNNGRAWLTDKRQSWRAAPASPGQVKFVRKIGGYRPNITKGQAADYISKWKASKALGRAGAFS